MGVHPKNLGMEIAPQPLENIEDAPLSEVVKAGGVFEFAEKIFGEGILEEINRQGLSLEQIKKFVSSAIKAENLDKTNLELLYEKNLVVTKNIKNVSSFAKTFSTIERREEDIAHSNSKEFFDLFWPIRNHFRVLLRTLINPEIIVLIQEFNAEAEDLSECKSLSTIKSWHRKRESISSSADPFNFIKTCQLDLYDVLPYVLSGTLEERQKKYEEFFKLTPMPQEEFGHFKIGKHLSAETKWEQMQSLFNTKISFQSSARISSYFDMNNKKYPNIQYHLLKHNQDKMLTRGEQKKLYLELKEFQEEHLSILQNKKH